MSADEHEEKLQLTKLEDVGKVIHAAKPLVYLLYSLIAGWVLVSGLKDFSPRTDAPNFMLALCKNQWPKGAKIDTPCGEIEAKVKNSDKPETVTLLYYLKAHADVLPPENVLSDVWWVVVVLLAVQAFRMFNGLYFYNTDTALSEHLQTTMKSESPASTHDYLRWAAGVQLAHLLLLGLIGLTIKATQPIYAVVFLCLQGSLVLWFTWRYRKWVLVPSNKSQNLLVVCCDVLAFLFAVFLAVFLFVARWHQPLLLAAVALSVLLIALAMFELFYVYGSSATSAWRALTLCFGRGSASA